MRFPVFARGSNPRVDTPILRKSLKYVTEQVESGRADWIDPRDQAQGIQCREVVYFGPRDLPALESETLGQPANDRALGLKFIGPPNPLPHFVSNLGPACPWDWSAEMVSA